jgi:hypothetical protein
LRNECGTTRATLTRPSIPAPRPSRRPTGYTLSRIGITR